MWQTHKTHKQHKALVWFYYICTCAILMEYSLFTNTFGLSKLNVILCVLCTILIILSRLHVKLNKCAHKERNKKCLPYYFVLAS